MILAMCGYCLWAITARSLPLMAGGPPAQGLSRWVFVGLMDSFFLVACYVLAWPLYRSVKTTITEDGITQPFRRGVRTIRWSEVTRVVSLSGAGVGFDSPRGRAVITYACFRDAGRLDAELRALVQRKVESGEMKLR
jgi:hypothetical protein